MNRYPQNTTNNQNYTCRANLNFISVHLSNAPRAFKFPGIFDPARHVAVFVSICSMQVAFLKLILCFDKSSVLPYPFCLPVIDLFGCVVQSSRGSLSVIEKQRNAENMIEDLPSELLENVAEWVGLFLRTLRTLLTPLVTTACSSIPEPRLLEALSCSGPSNLPCGRVSCRE